jgi:hypothetical protein
MKYTDEIMFIGELEFPKELFEGFSAGRLREIGCKNIPEDVPDCAIIKNGAFEWVKLDFVMKDTE